MQPPLKSVWWLLNNLKIEQQCDPDTPFLGMDRIYHIYTYIYMSYYRGVCSSTVTAVLVTTLRRRSQPEHPSTDEWIRRMWYMYMVEFY